MRTLLLVLSFVSIANVSNSQVLISLLFGDKLNSDGLEFGLDGGVNFFNLEGSEGDFNSKLNLGFYFDIRLKRSNWWLHTGVIAKSSMGATKLDVYSLDDPELDSIFAGGYVERNLGYFDVPVMIKYLFPFKGYLEGGFMIGLRNKAKDVFVTSSFDDDDTQFTRDIRDHTQLFDLGLIGGLGYKFKAATSMYLGARYYHGLVNIAKDSSVPELTNQSIYLVIGVPIGAGKAAKKAAEKEASEQ